jgi:phosphoglycolate phosphatase
MDTAILFDLDGTLLDTLEDLHNATNHTLAHFGCPLRSLEEIRSFVGNGARNQIRLSLPEDGNHPPLEEVLRFYQDYYNRTSADGTAAPYPGVMEALGSLKKKYPLAIVSNKPDPAVKALCAKYFPGIYARGVSQDCPRKPAPDMVYLTLKALDAETCVYVGDSEVDLATAKNAGVPCISVLWGFRDKKTLVDAGAEVFCDDVTQLADIVSSMILQRQGL